MNMGNIFTKQRLHTSKEELQRKLLHHIFYVSADNRDPELVGKGYKNYGFVSIEHFLSEIPYDQWAPYDNDKSVPLIRAGIGSRFVVQNEERNKGRCKSIMFDLSPGKKVDEEDILVELELDQPKNGFVLPQIGYKYRLTELILEKYYLQSILRKNKDAKGNNNSNVQPKSSNFLPKQNKLGESKITESASHPAKKLKVEKPLGEGSYSKANKSAYFPDFQKEDKNVSKEQVLIKSNGTSSYFPKSQDFKKAPKLYSTVTANKQELEEKVQENEEEVEEERKPKIESPAAGPILYGKKRGIQGANNSCYMDSFLFSVFYSTSEFDDLLLEKEKDSKEAKELRNILLQDIVAPLRSEGHYCSKDNVKLLRSFLAQFDERFSSAMMDVEELIYLMLDDILHTPNFIHYNNGNKDFIHQLLINNEPSTKIGDLQTMLQTSFDLWGVKLEKCPWPAFILQLPRSDGDLINYKAIIPNLNLDLESLSFSEKCHNCLKEKGEWESECEGKSSIFCRVCVKKVAKKHKMLHSKFEVELFAIICVRSAHYTAFVKRERDVGKDWIFFDSMAGKYPEVTLIKGFKDKLMNYKESKMEETTKHATEDCHLCIYLPKPFSLSQQ